MNANPIAGAKPRGRPRNRTVRRNILETTLRLLKSETVKSISIEGIAKASGVSKATIYRWWNSKGAIVIDAFIEQHIVRTPMRRDIPPGEALAEHMRALIEQYSGLGGRIVAQIVAEAQFDPTLAQELRERFLYGRQAVVREIVEEWRRSGGIDPSVNVEVLMDALYAPIYMRLLLGHAPLNADFARDLPASIFSWLGAARSDAARAPNESPGPLPRQR